MIKLFLPTIAVAFALVAGLSNAFAASVFFDFSPGPGSGSVASPHSFDSTPSGFTIVASGFLKPNTVTDLYQKYTSGNPMETGLGIAADSPDYEIPSNYFVQLDVQDLINHGFTSITFDLGSIQGSEKAIISTDSTAGTYGDASTLATLTGGLEQTYTAALTSRYFDFSGGGGSGGTGDVILSSATAHVPDAGPTAGLVGVVALGLFAMRRLRPERSAQRIS